MTPPSKSPGATLERYLHHWRERGALSSVSKPQKDDKPMSIALSRECGAGGTSVATAVGEKLDWPVYDRELVERISEDTGVQAQLLESIDEKAPHWLADCLDAFRNDKTIGGSGYAVQLLKTMIAISGLGNCVLVGRGAAQVLPPKQTLRVRLIAPIEMRTARIQELLGMSPQEARKHVQTVDKERDSFVKGYFHKDVTDPHDYDLILNPLTAGIDQTAEMIALAQKQKAECLNA